MITQWRQDFGQGDIPFYFVQLPGFERKVDHSGQQWAFQREAQAQALALPQTGMAVTLDIGEPNNLHPKNKQEVGRRLALIALAHTYGKGGIDSGPAFLSAKPSGKGIVVLFSHAEGLEVRPAEATALEVAGEDKVFHPAVANVAMIGWGGIPAPLMVSSPDVPKPVYVRYAWSNIPVATLFNGAGLPAGPFRTDDLPAPSVRGELEPDPEAKPEELGQ